MVSCKLVGALAVLLWCGINQTATNATAFIELMLDYITKMEVESSADLASKGSKGKNLRHHAMQHARTGTEPGVVGGGSDIRAKLCYALAKLCAR